MNDWDFELFREDLKEAVMKVHRDKCSSVETYIDCEDKEYKIIIEEVKKNKEMDDKEYQDLMKENEELNML